MSEVHKKKIVQVGLEDKEYDQLLELATDREMTVQEYMECIAKGHLNQMNLNEEEYWASLCSLVQDISIQVVSKHSTENYFIIASDGIRHADLCIEGIESDPQAIARVIKILFEKEDVQHYIGEEEFGVKIIGIRQI
ncbi:hypothetical protein [Thermoactinomyces sp. DSM 45892]|uniref:hypothetical protein n=1 Tax=Thermoactinomyces sp. DSM 45892 TaxID=1882753 RepID=UPI00089CAC8F|nr:hypothetical protein [Thermoactinomyces sp. DSM 45892]SDX96507.1 hypothetical protein SAMN05444416_101119 [Thermoactinomyces sp. DSM 45892]